MSDLFQVTKETIQQRTAGLYPLPPYLNKTIHVLEKGYFYLDQFYLYRFVQHMEKSGQGINPLIYTTVMERFSQYSDVMKLAVQSILVIKCTEDIIHQHIKVHRAFRKCGNAWHGRFPKAHSIRFSSEEALFLRQYQHKWRRLKARILTILKCLFHLTAEMIKLSKLYRDVYWIMQENPHTRFWACAEFISKFEEYQNQLIKDGLFLQEQLQKCQEMAVQMLIKMGHSTAAKKLPWVIEQIKGMTQPAQQAASALYEARHELLGQSGKIVAFDLRFGFTQEELDPLKPAPLNPAWKGSDQPPCKEFEKPRPSLLAASLNWLSEIFI